MKVDIMKNGLFHKYAPLTANTNSPDYYREVAQICADALSEEISGSKWTIYKIVAPSIYLREPYQVFLEWTNAPADATEKLKVFLDKKFSINKGNSDIWKGILICGRKS